MMNENITPYFINLSPTCQQEQTYRNKKKCVECPT